MSGRDPKNLKPGSSENLGRNDPDSVDSLKQSLDTTSKELEAKDRQLKSTREKLDHDSFLVRYLDCILDSITSGVMVFDILSRFTLLNREAEGILKRSGDELVGTLLMECPNLYELFALINRVRGNRPIVQRSNMQLEANIVDFEGNEIPLGVSINGLVDSDGTVMGYVVICKDLSERKRMIANLERAEKLSALGTMASGVAHNFNNILAAILGRVQLLLRYPDKAKIIEGLRTIEKSALDGAATVKRIQDFARKKPVHADFASVDVNEIVRDVISFTKVRWDNPTSDVSYRVVTDLQAQKPVLGSPSELREVLINLVINAIDAMPEGGTLRIETDSRGQSVRMVVTDTGHGIPEQIKRRIFDPFFTTKGVRGTGLGLSESYGIIKRHKGSISCSSVEGSGTSFVVEIPVAASSAQFNPVGAAVKLDRTLKALVVDDDEAQCLLLDDILSAEGHDVTTALGGQRALELMKLDNFDLMIVDLDMPGMDGWEVSRRAKHLRPGIRIIMMSGLGGDFPADQVENSRVDICLAKPLTLDVITLALAKLFADA